MTARSITPGEERELVNAVFAAALVMLAIFLGFVGVLAAIKPDVERISYLRQEFLISVWACLAGVLLAGIVSAAALAYLSGRQVSARWIVFGVYLLIVAVAVSTVSLAWAIGL